MTIRRSAARLVSLAVAALFALAACALIADPVTRPVSGRDCIGVPAATCQGFLDQAEQDAPDGFGIVTGIRIACTTVCTEDAGEADIETTYANGRTLSSHTGWQTAGPGPGNPGGPPVVQVDPTPLPIRPTCIGVPELWCRSRLRPPSATRRMTRRSRRPRPPSSSDARLMSAPRTRATA